MKHVLVMPSVLLIAPIFHWVHAAVTIGLVISVILLRRDLRKEWQERWTWQREHSEALHGIDVKGLPEKIAIEEQRDKERRRFQR